MDVQLCPHVIGWPCLASTEWAAWIQVLVAFVAIALAIYVPTRMRRIEELDRRESIVVSMKMVSVPAKHYLAVVGNLTDCIGSVPIELSAAIAACGSHLRNAATPPSMLPSLSHIEHAGRLLADHWSMAACNADLRSSQEFLATAKARANRVAKHLCEAEQQLAAWRRKHRLALFLT